MSEYSKIIIDADGPYMLGIVTPDPELLLRWMPLALANAAAGEHIKTPLLVHVDHGGNIERTHDIVRNHINKLRAHVVKHRDGSHTLTALHLYPAADPDDTDLHPVHRTLTHKQLAQTPEVLPGKHYIVTPAHLESFAAELAAHAEDAQRTSLAAAEQQLAALNPAPEAMP